ncbi:MAG: hypothetical protein PVJ77_10340, partial [Desulfobacterales bacterium]
GHIKRIQQNMYETHGIAVKYKKSEFFHDSLSDNLCEVIMESIVKSNVKVEHMISGTCSTPLAPYSVSQ